MPAANSRNKFDRKDSLELGERAENLFILLAVKAGWKISASSGDENINEHWDYLIEKEGQAHKVEVKSRKRITRNDKDPQSEFTWIELHGVRPKDPGWLFGKADLIAFEKEHSFLLVKKSDLLAVINRKVDLVAKARNPRDAVYKIYKREGRKDKLTLLPMADIEGIKFMEWQKYMDDKDTEHEKHL
jgi:hypothetical protein